VFVPDVNDAAMSAIALLPISRGKYSGRALLLITQRPLFELRERLVSAGES
jgi:hypothetical protein